MTNVNLLTAERQTTYVGDDKCLHKSKNRLVLTKGLGGREERGWY